MEEIKIGDYVVHDGSTTIHKVVGFSTGWVNCENYIKIDWLDHNSFRRKNLTKVNLEECIGEEIKDKLNGVIHFINGKIDTSIQYLKTIKKASCDHNSIHILMIDRTVKAITDLQTELMFIKMKEKEDEV